MKPKYLHEFLGCKIELPIEERSSGRRLKGSDDLEKWNTSVFPYSNLRPNLSKREEII